MKNRETLSKVPELELQIILYKIIGNNIAYNSSNPTQIILVLWGLISSV